MWPWGHLAVGYLCYSLLSRARGRRPDGAALLPLAVGTQLPDLVDKPLAWTLGVLPNGRSLAHSAVVMGAVVGLAWVLAGRVERRRFVAVLGGGVASHLLADAAAPANVATPGNLAFLLWPVLPAVVYDTDKSFLAHFASMEPTPYFLTQLGLVAVAGAVWWWWDGRPGLAALGGLRDRLGRAGTR